jgi:hypothetical protein
MSNQYVFNQYYIDFIKRLKLSAKKIKEDSEHEDYDLAKSVMKSIKTNYVTLDKSSDEYVVYVKKISEDFWESYLTTKEETISDWFEADNVKDVELYQNITISNIRKIINEDYLCHHFISVFYLFKHELEEELVKKYILILQESHKEELYEDITNEQHKSLIKRLNVLKNKNIKEKSGMNMPGMEDTMLGKLASEILEDVDVDKLQKSIGEKGDILKAIGDPDSGFSDLISNVSRKMATKLSNGELKQENLLQDAMKFASVMPGLFGGGGPGGPGGPGDGANSQPDMANMMNMMSNMMNSKEGMNNFKNMMGQSKRAGSKAAFNKNAYKKSMAANKLKAKLEKKRENTEVKESVSN